MEQSTVGSTATTTRPPSTSSSALPAITIISVTILVPTLVISVLGNVLVCIACVASKRLHSYTSVFIVSLATSDILVGVVSVPVWISVQLNGEPSMVTMPTMYMMWLCLDIINGTASIMNLVFISIDRFLAVCHPYLYHNLMSRAKVAMTIVFIWAYAVLIAGLYPTYWRGYAIFVFVLAFLVPLLIMIIAYSMIFKVAIAHARSIRAQSLSFNTTANPRATNIIQDLKAARTLSIVIGTFVLCWCPFFILNIITVYCKSCPIWFSVVIAVKILHYGSSAVNPIIYSCMNRSFRAAFKAILTRGVFRGNRVGSLDAGSTITRSLQVIENST
ncbi:predicted protein [Nematostella vectensis]|uniref:G-protein coupled receptors family 1 profile domain-containing protein n=1 Tax=Nematostella vectensis TaxID=45351 RepID=A7T7U0_NEMVE|nr:predicted protein [Nematostella vectensis]|eukprot:XP_001620059.1 hypothetical protein NEMVEDRAFT_v1g223523 [Nematostella vectensis]